MKKEEIQKNNNFSETQENILKSLLTEYNNMYYTALETVNIAQLEIKKALATKKSKFEICKAQFKNKKISKLEQEHLNYEAEIAFFTDLIIACDKKIDSITEVVEFGKSKNISKKDMLKSELVLNKAFSDKDTYQSQQDLLIIPQAMKTIKEIEKEMKEAEFLSAKQCEENAIKDAYLTLDGLKFIDEKNMQIYIDCKAKYKKYLLLDLEGKPVVSEIVMKKNKSIITYLHRKFFDFRDWNLEDFFYVEVNEKKSKKIMFAQHWLETKSLRTKYEYSTFEPDPDFNDETAYNFWKGFVEAKKGNVDMFINHVDKLVKGTKEDKIHIIKKFAYMCRFPHKNFGTVPAFRGKQGCGKTTLAGDTFLAVCPNHTMLTSNLEKFLDGFNGETVYMKFVIGEEALWGGDKKLEGKFKHAVTGSTREIEIKGITTFHIPNYCQFLLTSNEDWIMPVSDGDRRAEIFDCSDELIGNHEYFTKYRNWLFGDGKHALMHYFLYEIDLEGFNPRVLIENDAKLDVKLMSLGHIEKFIFSCLNGDIGDAGSVSLDKWNSAEMIVKREDLFNTFKDSTRSKIDQRVFSKTLNAIFDFPEKWKDNWRNSTKGSFYKLGSLEEARTKFSKFIKADYELLFGSKEDAFNSISLIQEEDNPFNKISGIRTDALPKINVKSNDVKAELFMNNIKKETLTKKGGFNLKR